MEKITRLFVCFSQEHTFNILYFMKNKIFLAVCNLPYYRQPSRCYGQRVLEKIPVNRALCYVHSGCFIVSIYCRYVRIEGSAAEQSLDSDVVVVGFKEVEI